MATGYHIVTMCLADGNQVYTNGVYKSPWLRAGRLLSPTITVEDGVKGDVVSIRVSNRPIPVNGAPHLTLTNLAEEAAGGLGGAFTWMRCEIYSKEETPVQVWAQAQQAT